MPDSDERKTELQSRVVSRIVAEVKEHFDSLRQTDSDQIEMLKGQVTLLRSDLLLAQAREASLNRREDACGRREDACAKREEDHFELRRKIHDLHQIISNGGDEQALVSAAEVLARIPTPTKN